MARFTGVYAAAPALAGILAAFVSFQYFEPAHRSLSLSQAAQGQHGSPWRADLVHAEPHTATAPAARTPGSSDSVSLSANALGHFNIIAEINGMPVDMMADTGATYVALTFKTALSLGLEPSELPFNRETDTANGVTAVAPVMLDELRVGSIVLHNVEAVVTPPGGLSQNLLGMSFINRLSRFEMSGRRLTLQR